MRRITIVTIILMLLLGTSALASDHAFAGLKKCKMCHKGEKKGNIFESWQAGPHAKAYAELASEKSKLVYAELGKEGNPQEDPECLKCHVTGAGFDITLTEKIIKNDGVSCESCHNAGADFFKMSIMKVKDDAIANGLNPDPKATCITCHNEESPTYKPFVTDERWEEIKHSRPVK
jgi:Cytochrome c554 and c-prime